jgi:hypothetical protein
MGKLQTLAKRQQRMWKRINSGKSGRGRPPIQFDQALVKHLASQFYSNRVIAGMLGTTVRTLLEHCSDALQVGRAPFMNPLRMTLYRLAMEGYWPALRLMLLLHTDLTDKPERLRPLAQATEQSKEIAILRFFERHSGTKILIK